MAIEVLLLGPNDAAVLDTVADEVFDGPLDRVWRASFFADPRHHLAVALDGNEVVGMVSAVHYVHPDKAPQLWINEVGVAPAHRKQGIGRRLLETMLARGKALGCSEAWLGTEAQNMAARKLYESLNSKPEPFLLYSFDLGGGSDGESGNEDD